MKDDFTIRTDESEARAADRLGIADAAYIYGSAVDVIGNNRTSENGEKQALAEATVLFAQALTPDAQLSLFLAGPSGKSQPLGAGGPEETAKAVSAYFEAYGYVGTMHPVSNVRVSFTGPDTAVSTCQIPCYHWLADDRMLLAPVSYRDEMVRFDGVWKIAKRSIYAMRFWVAEGYTPDPFDPSLSR